jgi:hypothetical protein
MSANHGLDALANLASQTSNMRTVERDPNNASSTVHEQRHRTLSSDGMPREAVSSHGLSTQQLQQLLAAVGNNPQALQQSGLQQLLAGLAHPPPAAPEPMYHPTAMQHHLAYYSQFMRGGGRPYAAVDPAQLASLLSNGGTPGSGQHNKNGKFLTCDSYVSDHGSTFAMLCCA